MKTVFQFTILFLVFKLVYFILRLFSSWTSGWGNQGIPRQAADPRGRTGFCWIRPWGQGSWTEPDIPVLEEVARTGQQLPFFHLKNNLALVSIFQEFLNPSPPQSLSKFLSILSITLLFSNAVKMRKTISFRFEFNFGTNFFFH